MTFRPIVIAGARNRGRYAKADDTFVKDIIDGYINIGMQIVVFSISCDRGPGKMAKDYCSERSIPFTELTFFFSIDPDLREKEFYDFAYKCRNATLAEIGTDFYLFVSDDRRGVIEDLVKRVRQVPNVNWTIFSESNFAIEQHDASESDTN